MVKLLSLRLRRLIGLSGYATSGGDKTATSRRWPSFGWRAHAASGLCCCLVAQVVESPLTRLVPAQRAKLFGSFMLLCIGCVALVILSWLALRVGRRHLRREDSVVQQKRNRILADDWASRPLEEPKEVGQDNNPE